MKFNRFQIKHFISSTIALALLSGVVHADDNPGVVTKVENAVERGAHAAADGVQHGAQAAAKGIERGAQATERGIKRGVKATANGVERASDATARTANRVAEKINGEKNDSNE
jgi:hypothetical protein